MSLKKLNDKIVNFAPGAGYNKAPEEVEPPDEIPAFVDRSTPYFDKMYGTYYKGDFNLLNEQIYEFMNQDGLLTVAGLCVLSKLLNEHSTHFFDERLCKAISSVKSIIQEVKERVDSYEDQFPPSPDLGVAGLIARDNGVPILWVDFGRDVKAVLLHISWTIEFLSGEKFHLDLSASFERMFKYMLYVGSFFDTLLLDWNKTNKMH